MRETAKWGSRGERIQSLSLLYWISLGFSTMAIAVPPQKHTPMPLAILSLDATGAEVQVIQVQLKALGYYKDRIDGQYNLNTKMALKQFQKARNLKRVDGMADSTTRISLEQALTNTPKCSPTSVTSHLDPHPQKNLTKSAFLIWGILGILGILGMIGVILAWRTKLFPESTIPAEKFLASANYPEAELPELPSSREILPITQTSLLLPLNIIDQLVQELGTTDTIKRRLAIWNLGQQGDSRAVQPLIDLMPRVDSQQRGLILSALAEIAVRTIKPMQRALAISIQDGNSQVRQNAIRDLLRIYDMMGQMSYTLRHALADPDPDVQGIARYALNHLNHFRVEIDPQAALPENYPEQN